VRETTVIRLLERLQETYHLTPFSSSISIGREISRKKVVRTTKIRVRQDESDRNR